MPNSLTMPALALLAALLAGCGTVTHYGKRPDFSLINQGMSQQEVVQRMGNPEEMAAQGNTTYLTYSYAPWHDHSGADGNKELYFVRLVNNRVESFGRKGDFDSTKPPERTINVNVRSE